MLTEHKIPAQQKAGFVIHNFMDDNQQTSASQNSNEQSGQTTQQVTIPVVIDFSILRPDSTDTSHFSTRSQNNADMQTKTSSKDE